MARASPSDLCARLARAAEGRGARPSPPWRIGGDIDRQRDRSMDGVCSQCVYVGEHFLGPDRRRSCARVWTQRVWTRLLVPVLGFSSEFRASDPQVIIFVYLVVPNQGYAVHRCVPRSEPRTATTKCYSSWPSISLSSALVMLTLIAFARHNMSMGVLPVTGTVVPLMFSTMCMMP